jgi:hypothetical protein
VRFRVQVLRWTAAALAAAMVAAMVMTAPLQASDHADPIDLLGNKPLEGGITDLFFFPNGDHVVVILCVRRGLTQINSLQLLPYTYRIHMDLHSTINRADDQSNKRYGGRVDDPAGISPDRTIEFRLMNDATLNGDPSFTGFSGRPVIKKWTAPLKDSPEMPLVPNAINVWTGVADDPFIFPVFFGTNVVAMVMTIPLNMFPAEQRDWVLWATSTKGNKQVDHVGRSLRTQNPRFELLNTLPPSQHAAATLAEHNNRSLMRDIFLRIGFQQTFAYRTWDHVPDVMLYTKREPVGFPNGRKLTDDVAEELARYGDTLLKEISYIAGGWPRKTTNDKDFLVATLPDGTTVPKFPYLAAPWPDKAPSQPPMLTRTNKIKIALIAIAVVGIPFLLGWLFAYIRYRRKFKLRYL